MTLSATTTAALTARNGAARKSAAVAPAPSRLEQLFAREAMTFDDVLLVPGYTEVLPAEVDVSIQLHPTLKLNIPVVSAAMDTVTEAELAIALARQGGLGIIHRNLSPEQQAEEVDKVKRSESGMIVDPITLRPHNSLHDAESVMSRYRISGVPIIDEENRLVGILTNRDVRFATNYSRPISEYMVAEGLITAKLGTTLEEAKEILHRYRIEKLPLVDESGHLKGLITYKDILKRQDYPHSAKDERGRLLVAGAIGVGEKGLERARALVNAGADAVAIDTAHGYSKGVIDTLRTLRAEFPNLPILAGNVVTADAVAALVEAGANVVKVGVGAGSICTTRIISGAGMPQLSAIAECAEAGHYLGIPVIADGGIRYSGDITKALAAGATAVMLGSLLAGLHESPGDIVNREGRSFKEYRGMGSLGAMKGRANDRYQSEQNNGASPDIGGKTVPEGIEGQVPYKGLLKDFTYQLMGGLRSGMGYVGAANIEELWHKAQFVRISPAGYQESHPHSIVITKEAPNYQIRPTK
ncbi:MAG: IMP dehydrogenase [Chloroflexi bacterium]|nr:MAG: IMP dehydrogenase [Chloroflexota bacterium]